MTKYKVVSVKSGRGYGISNFIGDATMTIITCGLWLVWVIIRELRD
jgi:hypothetical protein